MKKVMLALVLAMALKSASAQSCGGMSLGNMANLNGYVPFTPASAWNKDISSAPLDPNNAAIVAASGFAGLHLHHDWSSVAGGNYGIPYTVVDTTTQGSVPIKVNAYPSMSDLAVAPYPANVPIEGAPADCVNNGDQHVLVLDRATCQLYETFATVRCNGAYSADQETIWNMNIQEQRPWGWTSVDAAGLSVFAGLVRYDEVASGAINHALRFTMQQTKNNANNGNFVQPASHASGSNWSTLNVMGMRIRLKASFNISGYSAANQVILTAMKKYGMILADNGSYFYFQGTPDARWNDADLHNLDSITSSNFEVVQMTPAYPGWDEATAPTGAAPTISSLTASPASVAAGTPVTLSWATVNDSYDFIDKVGGVRGPSVTVTPTATTTYTLNATNQFGRTTKAVTVTVGGNPPPPPSSTITSVSVVCSPNTITTAQTSTCSATVSGTGAFSTAVTWAATGGAVTAAGLFTPSAAGTSSVNAKSVQDATRSGSASVTVSGVTPPPPPSTANHILCTKSDGVTNGHCSTASTSTGNCNCQ